MNRKQLIERIKERQSYLCVGLDTDVDKLPEMWRGDISKVMDFHKAIVDATLPYCVAYKINAAFFEVLGGAGWEIMKETFAYIPDTHFKIADAKRGDIGNTSHQYARAFFEGLKADAITVGPYMGEDSVRPFLEYTDKWTIVLGLTSNFGSADFQRLPVLPDAESGSLPLYQHIIQKSSKWGNHHNMMYVVGATHPHELTLIRAQLPSHFLLIPGVGVQGGSLAAVSKSGLNADCGLLVNASRAIIYASEKEDFHEAARQIAAENQVEMKKYLQDFGFI